MSRFPKKDIVRYRMERALETYSEAEVLRDAKKWFAAVNRLYYACYYAISAYFVLNDLKAFTHSGLKAAFNKELVRTGKIPGEEGKLFNQLFSFRQDGDYKDFVRFEESDVLQLFPKVQALIAWIEQLIGAV